MRAGVHDPAHLARGLAELGGPGGGHPVGTATIDLGKRLDQTSLLQPSDGAVPCAGTESDSGELLDVPGRRVAVLRSFGETGEDR